MRGCASQVWLATSVKPNGGAGPVLSFDGDSDAHIVRGLIAILFALYSGKGAKDILVHRRRRAVREARAARAPHAAALQRLPLDGRAHPPRRRRGARGGELITLASPTPTTNSASSASHVRTAALRLAVRLAVQAVVPRQPIEAELQHDLGRARRPASLALDLLEPLEEAADVDQQAGKLRADRIERRRTRWRAPITVSVKVAGDAPRGPVATEALQFEVMRGIRLRARELGAQPLAGEQLHRLDQRAAVAALAPRQPGQRAFRLVDGDVAEAVLVADLAPAEFEMLRAQRIDAGIAGRRAAAAFTADARSWSAPAR